MTDSPSSQKPPCLDAHIADMVARGVRPCDISRIGARDAAAPCAAVSAAPVCASGGVDPLAAGAFDLACLDQAAIASGTIALAAQSVFATRYPGAVLLTLHCKALRVPIRIAVLPEQARALAVVLPVLAGNADADLDTLMHTQHSTDDAAVSHDLKLASTSIGGAK